MFVLRSIQNTYIHSVGGMQNFLMLNLVVHKVKSGFDSIICRIEK